MFKTKAFDASIQNAGDGELVDGQFKALVSTYNVDSYGDVVMPGAFTDTLEEWEAKGQQIPVIWAHDWSDPFSHIGVVEKAQETERGLEVTGFISPEERESNPKAAQIWRLMKARRVTQFSFAFDVQDSAFVQKGEEYFTELRKMKIHEVGPCLLGVNQETELLAAKAASIDPKRIGPSSRKALEEARDTIARILDVTPVDEHDQGPSGQSEAANPGAGSASEETTTIPTATLLARLDLEVELAEAEAQK